MTHIETVDICIVGSGPSGTALALKLTQLDPAWAERMVIIDKAVHPRQKLCGGGVTHIAQNILADLGLPLEPESFPVKEARLVYRDKSYSFYGNPVFRIVRRDEFDHWLAQKAEARGVTLYQGEGVSNIVHHGDYVEITTSKRIIHARVLVGADGSRSFVRRRLKWDDESRVARLLEVLTPEDAQTQWEFSEGVAVFDFTQMTDGLQGYYWDFPSFVNGKPYMNRGVFDSRAVPERPRADLPATLREAMSERERDLDEYRLKGHPIRWFDKNGRFSMPRVILVGDAAGVDPLFGEGISFALGYCEPAAEAIVDAFARQDYSFDSYRERILTHPLFRQLRLRVRLARFAYLMKYPRLVRAGWTVARYVVKLTPFRNRDFVPARLPEMVVSS
jgi:flavin-dependent dehydrogenase